MRIKTLVALYFWILEFDDVTCIRSIDLRPHQWFLLNTVEPPVIDPWAIINPPFDNAPHRRIFVNLGRSKFELSSARENLGV